MLPGNEEIREQNGTVVLGLLHFFKSLEASIQNFFDRLPSDTDLQSATLKRYEELRTTAKQ
jgi:hypothetical protein